MVRPFLRFLSHDPMDDVVGIQRRNMDTSPTGDFDLPEDAWLLILEVIWRAWEDEQCRYDYTRGSSCEEEALRATVAASRLVCKSWAAAGASMARRLRVRQRLSDKGLALLARTFPRLTTLELTGTCSSITDAGVAALEPLAGLTSLSLCEGWNVTESGVAALQALTARACSSPMTVRW